MSDRLRREVDPQGIESAQLADGPRLFRKKPVVIEALRWTGANTGDVVAWCGGKERMYTVPNLGWVIDIQTLEGVIHATIDDWIIKGVAGEFYPCKPDIFEATYEEVHDALPEERSSS